MAGITAIIGGTGLNRIEGLEIVGEERMETPYGEPSAPLLRGRLGAAEVIFLARHGNPHRIPPHRINYRANLAALRQAGAARAIAVAAVGGIAHFMGPAAVALPEQIIDYTYGRDHTYSDGPDAELRHVDFTDPYDHDLRRALFEAAAETGVELHYGGCYGVTQGPRLESAAEVRRLERDGCHMVGMTGMPEAALAREQAHPNACCAVSANWAAGVMPGEITMEEIERNVAEGMAKVRTLLAAAVARLAAA